MARPNRHVDRWLVRLALRLGRSPRTVCRLAVDCAFAVWWLRLHGVEVGDGSRFAGLPVIKMVAGSQISLGKRTLVNSRLDSNSATMPHPTMLSTLAPGAVIRVGDGAGLSGVSIAAVKRVEIGDRTLVGSGACLWDTDFHPLDPGMRREHATRNAAAAPILVGSDAFIGARAMILKGVTIGNEAIVGAGAVVTRDVPGRGVVAGNPARDVGTIDSILARVREAT